MECTLATEHIAKIRATYVTDSVVTFEVEGMKTGPGIN